MPPRVLVLGGGFAGLAAVDTLARWRRRDELDVTLIDRAAESGFWPMLPDLISRRIRPERIAYPLAPHCKRLGIGFRRTGITSIDYPRCAIETDDGRMQADYLLVCLGVADRFPPNTPFPERTFSLKRLSDGVDIARELDRRILQHPRNGARANLVVVGGGYTGFEAAAQAARRIHRTTGLAYRDIPSRFRILVVELADRVLGNVAEHARGFIIRSAEAYGAEILTGTSLKELSEGGVATLSTGEVLSDALVVWSAGVAPEPAVDHDDLQRVEGGRMKVDEFLQVAGFPNVFAAGDVAGAKPGGPDSQPLRMGIQFSLVGGRHAARNIIRHLRGKALKRFDPLDPGYLVPLAPGRAAGIVMGMKVKGHWPLLAHYGLCAFRSRGTANRMGTLGDLLFYRGPRPSEGARR